MAFKKERASEDAKIATVEPIRSKKDIDRIRQWFIINGFRKYEILFSLGCYTGLRAGDLIRLKVKDVYFENVIKEQIVIREEKTAKVKMFPINRRIARNLIEWCRDRNLEDYLFEGKNGTSIDRSQIYRMIVRACEELEIKVNVGTHTMRKTFGYHHYKQFKDIGLLQQIFNHTSPDVTKRYIGITQDEINQSYIALNLEDTDDSLIGMAKKVKGNNRSRIKVLIQFISEYLKATVYKGIHTDFCYTILNILVYNKEYLESIKAKIEYEATKETLLDIIRNNDYDNETVMYMCDYAIKHKAAA